MIILKIRETLTHQCFVSLFAPAFHQAIQTASGREDIQGLTRRREGYDQFLNRRKLS